MRILFDQGVPVPLRRSMHPHSVDTAAERGWSQLQNGRLLESAEADGYDVLVTTDQSLRYQQNLTSRKIALLVLMTTSWPRIRPEAQRVSEAVRALPIGGYVEMKF